MSRRSLTVHPMRCSALALLWLGVPTLVPCLRAAPQANAVAIDNDTATAAYLLNFVRFTEWPASKSAGTSHPLPASEPYVIGVSGRRPLRDTLIRLVEGQQVRSRPVHVMSIKDVTDLSACHLVYLAPSPDDADLSVPIPTALNALRGKPVLTVSPATDFLAQGGLVQLYQADSRLRFDIAAETARAAGLNLNSRLLALARIVSTSR